MAKRRYDIYDAISHAWGVTRTEAKQVIRHLTDSEISHAEINYREMLEELENKQKSRRYKRVCSNP